MIDAIYSSSPITFKGVQSWMPDQNIQMQLILTEYCKSFSSNLYLRIQNRAWWEIQPHYAWIGKVLFSLYNLWSESFHLLNHLVIPIVFIEKVLNVESLAPECSSTSQSKAWVRQKHGHNKGGQELLLAEFSFLSICPDRSNNIETVLLAILFVQ